ncbi:MAG TPA: DUF1622 domain-containing protein [Chitinispirillaceae bacterium]|nr:DUF1622 domain-containing protein [Chitinispirillaceae bacterium]
MIKEIVEITGSSLEVLGISVIAGGALYAIIRTLIFIVKRDTSIKITFPDFRRDLGRAILLGLEFLVAGDIIRTVVVEPSFRSVGLLAAIVVIRTFLSFSLEIEMSGKLPWKKENDGKA